MEKKAVETASDSEREIIELEKRRCDVERGRDILIKLRLSSEETG
jgi:hypothetical protein